MAEQLEVALFEGLPHRLSAVFRWFARRRHSALNLSRLVGGVLMVGLVIGLVGGLADVLVVGLVVGLAYVACRLMRSRNSYRSKKDM